MKAAPTYLMFVFILLSGTIYCQNDSTIIKKQPEENIFRVQANQTHTNQTNKENQHKTTTN